MYHLLLKRKIIVHRIKSRLAKLVGKEPVELCARRWPDIAGRPYTIAQLEPDDGFEGLVEVQARDLAIVEIESSERLLKRTYLLPFLPAPEVESELIDEGLCSG